MNRLKLWIFTLLVVGAGMVGLRSASGPMARRALESADGRLAAARALLARRLSSR